MLSEVPKEKAPSPEDPEDELAQRMYAHQARASVHLFLTSRVFSVVLGVLLSCTLFSFFCAQNTEPHYAAGEYVGSPRLTPAFRWLDQAPQPTPF